MILDDFLYFDSNGLYCKYGNFYVDPLKPVKTAVISHAHADHAVPGNSEVYCTEATSVLMQQRYRKNAAKVFNIAFFDKPFMVGDVKITLVPAGHMLGSAQLLMEYQGVKYLYT